MEVFRPQKTKSPFAPGRFVTYLYANGAIFCFRRGTMGRIIGGRPAECARPPGGGGVRYISRFFRFAFEVCSEILSGGLTRSSSFGGGGFNRCAHSAGPGWRAVCSGVGGLFAWGSGGAEHKNTGRQDINTGRDHTNTGMEDVDTCIEVFLSHICVFPSRGSFGPPNSGHVRIPKNRPRT